MLSVLGHLPMLTRCVGCGKEKTTLSRVNFGLNAGGVLCENCRRGQSEIVSVSPGALQLLLHLLGGQIGASQNNSDNWNRPDRLRETGHLKSGWKRQVQTMTESFSLTDTERIDCEVEVRQLVNKYITHLLGYSPRLHKFLQNT
jgi:DNA repair protein RecO (recombination protein O)